MAARKERADGSNEREADYELSTHPPRASRSQLILSGFFLLVWLFFLTWLAFSS